MRDDRQTNLAGTAPDLAGLAQRKANAPLRPKQWQAPCDIGLFSDEAQQLDLYYGDTQMSLSLNARDVGCAVRDALCLISEIEAEGEEGQGHGRMIDEIDISDAEKPIIYLSNGQKFVLTITEHKS